MCNGMYKHISHEGVYSIQCVVCSIRYCSACVQCLYAVCVYSVCMRYAAYSVQHTVCSACVQCLYAVCVYSGCMWYTVYSVQYTVCSACVQWLHTVYLVCISMLPHDTVCVVIQCSLCVYSRSQSVTEVDVFRCVSQ